MNERAGHFEWVSTDPFSAWNERMCHTSIWSYERIHKARVRHVSVNGPLARSQTASPHLDKRSKQHHWCSNSRFDLHSPKPLCGCFRKHQGHMLCLYSGDSLLVRAPAGLVIERLRVRIPAGAAGEFSSPESTLCAASYSVFVLPPVLPQWHAKDPGHSAKSVGGRLHLNTHTPLTQRSRSGLTTPLSRHSVGTYQETSSRATRQGTLGHSRLSSLSHCGLILA